jgi:hypothetical protein
VCVCVCVRVCACACVCVCVCACVCHRINPKTLDPGPLTGSPQVGIHRHKGKRHEWTIDSPASIIMLPLGARFLISPPKEAHTWSERTSYPTAAQIRAVLKMHIDTRASAQPPPGTHTNECGL